MKTAPVKFLKIEMFSRMATVNDADLQWRERANTPGFADISEARAYMNKHSPGAVFVPFSSSNNLNKVKKAYNHGTPFRVVF